jgi:hypothetical protein
MAGVGHDSSRPPGVGRHLKAPASPCPDGSVVDRRHAPISQLERKAIDICSVGKLRNSAIW